MARVTRGRKAPLVCGGRSRLLRDATSGNIRHAPNAVNVKAMLSKHMPPEVRIVHIVAHRQRRSCYTGSPIITHNSEW